MEKSPSWSRAHDWKSCNREKRFESSNLSFSAKKTRRFSRVFCRQKRDSVQSKYDCTRLRRRTLRCTLHYASKLARSRCKANLSFSKTRGAEEMFVAKQQLISLSPPKKPDGTVGFFAVKREILAQSFIGVPAGYCVLAGRRSTRAKK